MTEARKEQVGGDHYKQHAIQPIDIIDEYHLSFRLGSVMKYVLRDKDAEKRIEDLKKARHYLDWEIERLEGSQEHETPPGFQPGTTFPDPLHPVGPLPPTFSPGWPVFPMYPQCDEIDLTQHPVDTNTPEWHRFRDITGNDPDKYRFSSETTMGPPSDENSSEAIHPAVSNNFTIEFDLPNMVADAGQAVVMKRDGSNWAAGDRGVVIAGSILLSGSTYINLFVDFGTLGAADVAPVKRKDFYIIGQEAMWKHVTS